MINRLTNNLTAKVICLILAFGLWTYVVSGEAKVDNFPGSIPLEVRNKPENLVVVKNDSEVQIKIMADQGTWKKLSSSSFNAYIDLSGLSQGTHEVVVQAQSNIANVQIVEIKPAKIMVSMEPVVTKSVSISAKIEGSAAEGMMATDVSLNPNRVDLSGPESILSHLSEAKAVVVLNDENSGFTKSVRVTAFDDQNKEYSNISFDPQEVQAKVTISKAAQAKTVGIKVITDGRQASGYWVSQITTDPATVTIAGQSTNLANTNFIETKPISIEGLNSNKNQQVNLNIPEGITLVESITKVNVEMIVASIDSSKETVIGYNYTGLNSNLKVSSVDPTSIRVVFSGSSDKLISLDTSQIKVNLDLSNYALPGTYALDINDSMISKSEALRVVSLIPSSVRIIIESK